jgi:hypothetical protein
VGDAGAVRERVERGEAARVAEGEAVDGGGEGGVRGEVRGECGGA